MRVANAYRSCEPIYGDRKLDAMLQHFSSESVWNLDATGTPIVTVAAVGHVGPTFQQDASAGTLLDNIEPTFEADKVLPGLRFFSSQARHLLGPLTRTLHQFSSIGRRMADAAVNFNPDDTELLTRRE